MRVRLTFGVLLVAALIALAPRGASAAPEGRYWTLTPVAGWAQFSDKLKYPFKDEQDQFGVGGRLGYNLNEFWGLEASGFWSPTKEDSTDKDIPYLNFGGSLVYTPVRWTFGAPYFAAGGGYSRRTASGYDDIYDDRHFGTFETAVGWNSWFGEKAALRLEARNVLNVPKKNWGSANTADQQYLAGLSLAWGGTPRDTDMDGVPDKKDQCAATPAGAKVDVNGCPIDSDGDGVFDGLDTCPGTPKGATVDAKGCPRDTDGDGVLDGLDQCADTPKGATVDARGCTMDSDGDGVVDGLDQCANTPKGATVNAQGCPSDADSDGVPDGLDKCPNTAAGLKVDSDGCPIEVTERETQLLDTGMIRLQGVNFETGKADLLPESFPILDEVGTILRKWPQLQIEVGGHTDARGTAAANQSLSEARANSVRGYLLEHFSDIKAEQLSARGYGEAKPIAPNNNQLNMAKNRRVEFVVLNKDVLKNEVERRKLLQK
jgi:outer membrane protein OmpA-like peptidoglycan-associated protein